MKIYLKKNIPQNTSENSALLGPVYHPFF